MCGVNHMHAHGIVHRDLKLDNILFKTDDPNATVKIIDFGFATMIESGVKMHDRMGTPLYVAPEILKGNYDNRCDIWSIGIILYNLFSGEFPFDDDSI
jgi:calcium-dependent protein kinase